MVALGEVAPLVRRPVPIDPDRVYNEIGARSFGRGLFNKPSFKGADLTWEKLFRIEAGDLVFSNIKAWEGAFAAAGPEHHGKVASHRYLTCVPDSQRALAGFLFQYLRTPEGVAQIQAVSPGSADRNRTLSTRGLANVRVPLPPLDEQRRIVARLDAVAARLAARAAAAERQEAELAAMLRVLARTDTTPTPMRELLTLRPTDVEVRPEGQYQFSGVYSFGRGVFRSQRKSGADFAYPCLTTLRAGDFTYPKLMAWEGAYGIVPPECDGTVVSPEFPVFAVNAERVRPEVLALHFGDPQTWPRLSGASTGTNARRRRLHPETLLAYEMPLPAPSVQSLLQEVMAKATAVRALNATTADDAAALLPAMLHDIFGRAAC